MKLSVKSTPTKAEVVDQLLSRTYICTLCKGEVQRFASLPSLRVCLDCATPGQIADAAGSLLRLFENMDAVEAICRAGIAKYSEVCRSAPSGVTWT